MKTPGEQVCAALLERPEQRRFEITLERKAGPILAAPMTIEPVQQVVPGPALPLRLRSLIPGGRTVGSGISYVRETSITNSPVVPVAAGAPKPQAGLTYEQQQKPVITIPAYLKVSSQAWEDFAMFQSWIDARTLYALSVAEEAQLLNGNGVAPNLEGLMLVAIATPQVTGTAPPPPGAQSLLANVAAGIVALYGRGYQVTGIVLNPVDWANAVVARDANGLYLVGYPGMFGPNDLQSLWGFPLVLSTAMASGSYLVGQFNPFCQIFDREDAAIDVADENQDDFVRNLVTVRAEERLAFAIYQPGAFSKGTFAP